MRMKTRMLSILLSALMVTSMAPSAVFADETVDDTTVVVEEQVNTEVEENTAEEQNETVSDTEDQSEEEVTEEVTTEEAVATTEEVTSETKEDVTESEADKEEALDTLDDTSVSKTLLVNYADGTSYKTFAYTGNAAATLEEIKNQAIVTGTDADDKTCTLVYGSDYSIKYQDETSDNASCGEHILTVTGLGAWNGYSGTFMIKITSQSLSTCTVTLPQQSYNYIGSSITPTVTVTNAAGKVLVLNQDYTVAYSNNINVGKATVTITGIGVYAGSSKVLNFNIVKTPISKFKITTAKTSYAYNKKYQKPAVAVYYGTTKISAANYTVSYKNNKNIGTATVTVKAKGSNISGTKKITFKITPYVPTLKTAKSVSKGIYLSWSKSSNAKGYYVYRSADSGKTYKKIATTKSRSYTDKAAYAGKKYIYKIAAYKKSYVSTCSNTKTVLKKITKPVISSVKAYGSYLKVTWGKVTGATYELYRKEAGLDWELVYEGSKTYFYDDDTDLYTTYSYKVKAIASNSSATSSTKSGKIKSSSSSSTGSTTLTLKVSKASGADSFYASWNKYKNAVKYQIFWCKYSSFPAKYVHDGYTSNLHFQPQECYAGTGTWYVKVRAITVSGNKTYYNKWSSVKKVTIK